ncbi:galactose oxidase [Tilletiopsis washingtonensis]|uniref:Galactose oxidase n=1 Tax=Tilletiopsis washingtonensis TaxID=58919 RepID=A0A316ZJZ4_9BASI|nr:galactose oxidase [Tilletiopsis washingtonensis]PWO01425.1 galactose oxidase [Tilletiopsis washingtonensis]
MGARVAGGKANTAAIIGSCGVTAQHMFLGDADTVYIVDKTEANPLPTADRANSATAASFSLSTGLCRPMYTQTNQFCAAGGPLGDGRWVSGGGNPAQNGQGQGDGLRAIRSLTPCNTNGTCQWSEGNGNLGVARWYPAAETTGDGSMIWLGGYNAQVFLPYPQSGNTPTAEYFPSKGGLLNVPVLNRAWPFSLYPLTHYLSDGRIFILAGSSAVIWNPTNQQEQTLPNMPNGPRTYPSGGSAVLLPLTPANNYAETSMLCGGNSAIKDWGNQWCPAGGSYAVTANTKCDLITPLANNAAWTSAPDMPSPRLMGTMILLPDNNIALVNGAQAGTQGFNCDGPGGSMASRPANTAYVYNPQARTWATLATQLANRGYHSSATLLPDGAVLVGGSSPHDNIEPWTAPFPSEFRLEKIFPSYYDAPRPSNAAVPTAFPYGGAAFTVTFGSAGEAQGAYVRLIRTGWSTHGLQMQQRSYELRRTVNGNAVTFAGMPSGANRIFPPGAALAFLVVNGVPAMGKSAIVGSGRL